MTARRSNSLPAEPPWHTRPSSAQAASTQGSGLSRDEGSFPIQVRETVPGLEPSGGRRFSSFPLLLAKKEVLEDHVVQEVAEQTQQLNSSGDNSGRQAFAIAVASAHLLHNGLRGAASPGLLNLLAISSPQESGSPSLARGPVGSQRYRPQFLLIAPDGTVGLPAIPTKGVLAECSGLGSVRCWRWASSRAGRSPGISDGDKLMSAAPFQTRVSAVLALGRGLLPAISGCCGSPSRRALASCEREVSPFGKSGRTPSSAPDPRYFLLPS